MKSLTTEATNRASDSFIQLPSESSSFPEHHQMIGILLMHDSNLKLRICRCWVDHGPGFDGPCHQLGLAVGPYRRFD